MRYIRAILLSLVALAVAGTASAYTLDVEMTASNDPMWEAGDSVYPTDMITVDLMLSTEGVGGWYGFVAYVDFNTAVLSPVSGSMHLMPGMNSSSYYSWIYMYPSSWATGQSTLATGGAPAFTGSVMTMVFHVMEVPNSTDAILDVNFDYGPYGIFTGPGPIETTGDVVLTDLVLHVPEPTTTMLMGLGLLGILYAGRRR